MNGSRRMKLNTSSASAMSANYGCYASEPVMINVPFEPAPLPENPYYFSTTSLHLHGGNYVTEYHSGNIYNPDGYFIGNRSDTNVYTFVQYLDPNQ